MEDSILESIKYFSLFNYPPTDEEIYLFTRNKLSFDRFLSILEKMVEKGDITVLNSNSEFRIKNSELILNSQLEIGNYPRYTVGEYGKNKVQSAKFKVQNFLQRQDNSIKKLSNWRFKSYIKLISFFPQIKLVGLSGSISMANAKDGDDIDLFIITGKNRLFTGRFIALLLAGMFFIRRKRDSATQFFHTRIFPWSSAGSPSKVKRTAFVSSFEYRDKLCLNLFFDETDILVPKFKQSEYVAHEVLQMKPIINKQKIYEKFLKANLWVKKIFPNSTLISAKFKVQSSKLHFKVQNFKFLTVIFHFSLIIFNLLERLLKNFQLASINRHKTSEIITSTQLWFHPDDFLKKIKVLK